MPNAQTHLACVTDLLGQPRLKASFPWLESEEARAAFLLGAISPDARAISRHPRTATHFFDIPPGRSRPAPAVMLDTWPGLADVGALGRTRAAFVAGYITHLIMDQVWLETVVMPDLFIEGEEWGTGHPNWRVYGILMTYLEYRAAARLPQRAVEQLAQARPEGWLPFISDQHLADWRDHVVEQITTGGARLISAMFSRSNRLSPAEMEAIVLSEERMAAEAFRVIPRAHLDAFEAATLRRSLAAVTGYLNDGKPAEEEES